MSNAAEQDFDVNAWEKGTPTTTAEAAPSEDFDVFQWENGDPKAALASGKNAPPVPPPAVDMKEDLGPAPAGKLSGLPNVHPHTPTNAEGAGDVALSVAPMAGAMALALSPEVVSTLATAAAQHPLAAKVIAHGLEGLGLGAGWRIATKMFGK